MFSIANSRWTSWSSDNYSLAVPIFVAIARFPDHPQSYKAAELLWNSYLEFYNGVGAELLAEIGLTTNHPNSYDAAQCLWKSKLAKYYSKATPLLEKIGYDLNHPYCFEASQCLWNSSFSSNNRIAKSLLERICQRKDAHEKAFASAELLWRRYKSDNAAASSYFEFIVSVSNHPKSFLTAKYLFEGTTSQRSLGRQVLDTFLDDTDDDKGYEVATIYWRVPQSQEKQLARNYFRQILSNFYHPKRFTVAKLMWNSKYDEDDREIAKGVLHYYAAQPSHEHTMESLSELWKGGSDLDHQFLLPLISEAAGNVYFSEDKRKSLVRLLRESSKEEDQSLGIKLFLQHFVSTDKCPSMENKKHFNMNKVRDAMPRPLPDLTYLEMDIVAEFTTLMNLMNNESSQDNPFYVSMEAITGGDSSISTLQEIRLCCLGFLKTLVGESLDPGERAGWQMHAEHRTAMINSLKHIILNIKEEMSDGSFDSIQRAMLSLGIVLNGILHCPTGQAEAIESAVNMIVRKHNISGSDVCAMVGHLVVASAVTKAFYNAFHHSGGGVHQLSRARLVLQEELGLHHAIAEFQEQISKVTDQDIPQIYSAFYEVFTVKFVIAEARRNIPDPIETRILEESHWNKTYKEKCKSIKLNKPITLSALIGWLHDKGESELLHSHYGIAEDYLSISDKGIQNILVKMEYLNEIQQID